MKMTSQKQHLPSFATTFSALGILLYCVGFLRVELELNNQKKRLNALEDKPETKPPSSDPDIVKIIKDTRGMYTVSFFVLFCLFYAAFKHSLKFHVSWNVSYHPKQEHSTIINSALILINSVFWLPFARDWVFFQRLPKLTFKDLSNTTYPTY